MAFKLVAYETNQGTFAVSNSELVYEKLIDVYVRPSFQGRSPGFSRNVYRKAMDELALLKKVKKTIAGKEAKTEKENIKVKLEDAIHTLSIKEEQNMKRKMSNLNDHLRVANAEINSLRMRDVKPNSATTTDSDEYIEPGPSSVRNSSKLADQYSDILDQEWCEAFEKLKDRDDITKARLLNSIIRESFGFCKDKLLKQTENIASELLQIQKDTFVGEKEITKELQNLTQTLNSTRQKMASTVAQRIAEDYVKDKLKNILKPSDINAEVKKYVVRCVELCWNFAISDPPLVISADDTGMDFQYDVYRAYTRSEKGLERPKVEFIVWPALYLYEGGPLVSKGVAQPCGN